MKNDDQVVKGKMEIAEVDHDEFKNDYDITVTCQENSANAQQLENCAGCRSQHRARRDRQVLRRAVRRVPHWQAAEERSGDATAAARRPPPRR